jgi:hypothetical protein
MLANYSKYVHHADKLGERFYVWMAAALKTLELTIFSKSSLNSRVGMSQRPFATQF